jgi:hypothetical protein
MKIENLKKVVSVNNVDYYPNIYPNAWGNWTIAYISINCISLSKKYLCSVCIEPDNEPVNIEDTLNCAINSGVGNARTFDDAIDMINNYIETL